MTERMEWKRGAPEKSGEYLVREVGGAPLWLATVRVKDRTGHDEHVVVEIGGGLRMSDIGDDASWFDLHEFAEVKP